jgi:hypothetical protein
VWIDIHETRSTVPVKIGGLPAHILLVHGVIVLVPLAAAMLVASAVWPAARAKLGFLTPAVALVALAFIPVTMNAGKWLRDHIRGAWQNDSIIRHTHLAYHLWPWVLALFVVSTAVWLLGRSYEMSWRPSEVTARKALPVWATALIAVVAIVVSVGAMVELYRIGESGSKAVWPPGITTG